MAAGRRRTTAALIGLSAVLLLGCLGGANGARMAQGAPPQAKVPHLKRVAVVVMENKNPGQVIGNSRAPWITKQAHRFGYAARYFGVSHPSLPNYLALTSGRTFGINTDCTACRVSGRNIIDQLDGARINWKVFMESMPRPCFRPHSNIDETGEYAKRHNPFFYYRDVISKPSRCQRVVPYSQFSGVANSSGGLPPFVWITPNLCHDMHDCGVRAGDNWLRQNMPPLIRALGPRGAVFIVWDEGNTSSGCCHGADGGRTPLVVLGGAARRHAVERHPVTHYSLLHTVERSLGLGLLAHAKGAGNLGRLLK